jgi:intracellular multiplication protein IcmB
LFKYEDLNQMSWIAKLIAKASLLVPKPLYAYCDIETADGNPLITKGAEYVSMVRVRGITKMVRIADVDAIVEALRVDLQGALEQPGNAIQAWYVCDPGRTEIEIAAQLSGPRAIAGEMDLRLDDIFSEREKRWPEVMRFEECFLVLWSRRNLLSREETNQANKDRGEMAKNAPRLGTTDTPAQNIFLSTEVLAVKHAAFVQRIISGFRVQDIVLEELTPREALIHMREALYPETVNSNWKPSLPGDPLRPRMPEPDEQPAADHLLWPSLQSQIFLADAVTAGTRMVNIGNYDWSGMDITLAPEDARPFSELVSRLASGHIPWRISTWIESGGSTAMTLKAVGAEIGGFVPGNKLIANAFKALRSMKETTAEVSVRWRTSFATWAPAGEKGRLNRNAAMMAQRVMSWGNCTLGMIAGDPLEGVMGSALGLTFGTTAPAAFAPLSQVLRMMPWCRPASPWKSGPALFRTPDGRIWPYDPSGSGRGAIFSLFVAPPRRGKSTLANAINLALCLSRAAQGSNGTKLPLIGKLDIGESAKGLILLLQDALPAHRQYEAAYVRMQFGPGFEVNIFDTQLGCRGPLRLERTFIQNFLSLATTSLENDQPFEGMDQFIGFVVDEAYRMFGDAGPNRKSKRYEPGIDPEIEAAIKRHHIVLEAEPWWWEIVDQLCLKGEHQLAERAQHHAVPVLEDLITAARSPQVRDNFAKIEAKTRESLPDVFERYIKALIRQIPSLNRRTSLNLGGARVIVLDLEAVAPQGSAENDRQTSMMYMLGRHILARNFFLKPEDLSAVPAAMRVYHAKRFSEIHESTKRLDYDEYHRTKNAKAVRAQVVRDILEGGKHNVQIAVSSQSIQHFDDELISFTTDRFVLGAGDQTEADLITKRFQLSEAGSWIVRNRLNGPDSDGGGAPFLVTINAYNRNYEQMLVNSLGPVELWALSTSPHDVNLRSRIYSRLGPAEGRRRLAVAFPKGTATAEIERRKDERLKRGEQQDRAEEGVYEELARELFDGRGVGMKLRDVEIADVKAAAE